MTCLAGEADGATPPSARGRARRPDPGRGAGASCPARATCRLLEHPDAVVEALAELAARAALSGAFDHPWLGALLGDDEARAIWSPEAELAADAGGSRRPGRAPWARWGSWTPPWWRPRPRRSSGTDRTETPSPAAPLATACPSPRWCAGCGTRRGAHGGGRPPRRDLAGRARHRPCARNPRDERPPRGSAGGDGGGARSPRPATRHGAAHGAHPDAGGTPHLRGDPDRRPGATRSRATASGSPRCVRGWRSSSAAAPWATRPISATPPRRWRPHWPNDLIAVQNPPSRRTEGDRRRQPQRPSKRTAAVRV